MLCDCDAQSERVWAAHVNTGKKLRARRWGRKPQQTRGAETAGNLVREDGQQEADEREAEEKEATGLGDSRKGTEVEGKGGAR